MAYAADSRDMSAGIEPRGLALVFLVDTLFVLPTSGGWPFGASERSSRSGRPSNGPADRPLGGRQCRIRPSLRCSSKVAIGS